MDQHQRFLEDLRSFNGNQTEFDQLYREICKSLQESTAAQSDPSLRAAIAEAALDARRRARAHQQTVDRRNLLLLTSRTSKASPSVQASAMADEVTASLHRITQTMQEQVQRSSENYRILGKNEGDYYSLCLIKVRILLTPTLPNQSAVWAAWRSSSAIQETGQGSLDA